MQAWSPSLLALTHFGTWTDVEDHIDRLRGAIVDWGELAKVTDADGFAAALRAGASSAADPATQRSMAGAVPPGPAVGGLDRYWRKKAEREAAT